jgi:predicted transcriptional regulator
MASKLLNEHLADEIIDRLAQGDKLRAICRDLSVSHNSVSAWEASNKHNFRDRMNEARRSRVNLLVDEILEIADDCPLNDVAVKRAALQIRARQFVIDRLAPAKLVKADQEQVEQDVAFASAPSPAEFLKQWQARNPKAPVAN